MNMNPITSAQWEIARQLRDQQEKTKELSEDPTRYAEDHILFHEGVESGLSAVHRLFADLRSIGRLKNLDNLMQKVSGLTGECASPNTRYREGFDSAIADALELLQKYRDVESLPLPFPGGSQAENIARIERAANALILRFQEDRDTVSFLRDVAVLHNSYGRLLLND